VTIGHLREEFLPALRLKNENAQGIDLFDTYLVSHGLVAPLVFNSVSNIVTNITFTTPRSIKSFRYQNYIMDAATGFVSVLPVLVSFGSIGGTQPIFDYPPATWTFTSATPETTFSMFYSASNSGPQEKTYQRGELNIKAGTSYAIFIRNLADLTGTQVCTSWIEIGFYK